MKIPNFPAWYQAGTLKWARESQSSRNGPAPITSSIFFMNSWCIFHPCHLITQIRYSSVLGHPAFVSGISIGTGFRFVACHLFNGAGMEARCPLVFVGLDASTVSFSLFEACARGRDFRGELRQPFRLGYQHLIGHLPDFFGIADRANQRIVQHGLFEQGYITVHGGLDTHLLDAGTGRTGGGTSQGQISNDWIIN